MNNNKAQQKTPLITYYTKNRDKILEKQRSRKKCDVCKKEYAYSYFNKHLCVVNQR